MMKAMLTQEANKREEVEGGWQHDTEGNKEYAIIEQYHFQYREERK